MTNVVTEIVKNDLCSGCGVCAGLCPTNALSMVVQYNGDLVPRVDAERCSNKCRYCLEVCPFLSGVHDPRTKNEELFSGNPSIKFNKEIGWYNHTIVGYRKNEVLRNESSSGGLVTWCLEVLLKKRFVTRVAVVRFSENHNKGFFEFYDTSSVVELRLSSGSVYHPVEVSEILKKIKNSEHDRWAVVGVPCLCAAIRNNKSLREKVPFVIGLACGMYQNKFYTEILLNQSGVACHNVINIEYRRKSDVGAPSNFRFRGTDNRGPGKEVEYLGLPYFLGKQAFFRLNACNFCKDVFAETADACFMDAWLPEYIKEPKGTSLVVLRNSMINQLFIDEKADGKVQFDEIKSDKVVQSQRGHVRRKRELVYMRLGLQKLKISGINKATITERVNWWVQFRAQNRSKVVWAKYGQKYGQFVFWLALSDVLILPVLMDCTVKFLSLPKRIFRKLRSAVFNSYRL